MAISRIASQDATGTGTSGAITVTYPGSTTSGNLLVAIVGDTDGNFNRTNVTSNSGTNLWFNTALGNQSSTNELGIWVRISDGTETAIVGNCPPGIAGNMAIYEYTGITSTGVGIADQNAAGGSSGTNSSSTGTTPTTLFSNELLIAAGFSTGVAVTFSSWSNGFNLRNSVSQTTLDLFTADQIVSAKAAYTSTLTVSANSTFISACISTFEGISQGSAKVSPLSILAAG